MLRLVRQARFPDDVAGGRERGGALGAEVNVHPVAFDDGRGRRVAVLGVREVSAPKVEDFDVLRFASALDVEGDRAERRAFLRDRRRHPDASAGDGR